MRHVRRLILRAIGFLASLRRRPLHSLPAPRRVLVIKPDHLGDLLMLTPALAELRTALPDAHIALLAGPWAVAAVEGNPAIDTLLLCPFPGFTRKPKPGLFQPYMLLLRNALLLRAGHYDTALIARDDHWWGALLALVAGIPRRIGHAAPDVAPLLTEALPYDPDMHVTRQSFQLVERLTGRKPCLETTMFVSIAAQDDRWAGDWLRAHGCDDGKPLVAIHPGAGGAAKLWVAARWAMVASELATRGWRVVLTGGPGEQALVDDIASRLAEPPLLLAGKTTLGQLAALYRRCDFVLGVDSGPMHLATATGARTIALYGPIDPGRFGPWGQAGRHQVVRSGLWCSPCGAVDACPRGTGPSECMTTISASAVLSAVERHERAQAKAPVTS